MSDLPKGECVKCLIELHNQVTTEENEIKCIFTEKLITFQDSSQRLNGELLRLKRERRRIQCE